MTQHDEPTRPTQPSYDAFRERFGAELVTAVREREQPQPGRAAQRGRWRRRVAVAVPSLAVAAVAFSTVDLSSPGSADAPVFGVSAAAAAAAVRELSDSLERGVLVRVAVNRTRFGPAKVSTESDWTDLATRDRHTRVQSDAVDSEFWNPSLHERWTFDRRWRSADGRAVVNYTNDDVENASSGASPKEEVQELMELAHAGKLTLKRDGDELVVERTQRCFATANLGYMECADPKAGPDRRWPASPPGNLKAVTSFETWWLAADGQPRILREENGSIDAGSGRREVVFHRAYRRWEVLPPTASNLRLVNPPEFAADDYLVLKGNNAVGDAINDGRVVCVGLRANEC